MEETMNWFILELPNIKPENINRKNIKSELKDIEVIINKLKKLLAPH